MAAEDQNPGSDWLGLLEDPRGKPRTPHLLVPAAEAPAALAPQAPVLAAGTGAERAGAGAGAAAAAAAKAAEEATATTLKPGSGVTQQMKELPGHNHDQQHHHHHHQQQQQQQQDGAGVTTKVALQLTLFTGPYTGILQSAFKLKNLFVYFLRSHVLSFLIPLAPCSICSSPVAEPRTHQYECKPYHQWVFVSFYA
jgi:hypothetical protein